MEQSDLTEEGIRFMQRKVRFPQEAIWFSSRAPNGYVAIAAANVAT